MGVLYIPMTNNNGKILITESELRALIREEIEAALDEGLLDFLKPSPMMQVSKASAEVAKKLKPIYDVLKKKGDMEELGYVLMKKAGGV